MSRARNLANLGDGSGTFKIGDTIWSSRSAAPAQWLACDGAAVSRTTYAALFTAIGTAYGIGDGSTTFNLPDARGRSPVGAGQGPSLTNRARGDTGGAESHTLTEAQMPLHGHPFFASYATQSTANSTSTGGFMTNSGGTSSRAAYTGAVSGTQGQQIGGTGGGAAHNNMQPFIAMNCFIYAGI
jgi:microcystin-dependent protein